MKIGSIGMVYPNLNAKAQTFSGLWGETEVEKHHRNNDGYKYTYTSERRTYYPFNNESVGEVIAIGDRLYIEKMSSAPGKDNQYDFKVVRLKKKEKLPFTDVEWKQYLTHKMSQSDRSSINKALEEAGLEEYIQK